MLCKVSCWKKKKTYFESKYVWVINQWGGWLITHYLFTSRRHFNWLGKAGSNVRMTANRERGGDLLTVLCCWWWGWRSAALDRTGVWSTGEVRVLPTELQILGGKKTPISTWLNNRFLKVPSSCLTQKVSANCARCKTLEGKIQTTILPCASICGIRSQI